VMHDSVCKISSMDFSCFGRVQTNETERAGDQRRDCNASEVFTR
jgi:hypothetical protein